MQKNALRSAGSNNARRRVALARREEEREAREFASAVMHDLHDFEMYLKESISEANTWCKVSCVELLKV